MGFFSGIQWLISHDYLLIPWFHPETLTNSSGARGQREELVAVVAYLQGLPLSGAGRQLYNQVSHEKKY